MLKRELSGVLKKHVSYEHIIGKRYIFYLVSGMVLNPGQWL